MSIIEKVYEGQVFGPASFDLTRIDMQVVQRQMGAVASMYTTGMMEIVSRATPNAEQDNVALDVKELVSSLRGTAVGLAAALSAGEVTNTERLADVAIMVGVTGWGNFLCDRGNPAMPLAILRLCGMPAKVPESLTKDVDMRLGGLQHIEIKSNAIARPEDAEYVLQASRDDLMYQELLAHELSMEYQSADDRNAFLRRHAARAAGILIVTAALPSATTPLYATYRHQNGDLPGLEAMDMDPAIFEMHRVLNAGVRVFDDEGDMAKDASKGAFSINLFNEKHPEVLDAFFELAHIAGDTTELHRNFVRASHPEMGWQAREDVAAFFTDHLRSYVAEMPPEVLSSYSAYIRLCKRAIEAAYVNRRGMPDMTG